MRWTEPELNDTRIVKKFCFLPLSIGKTTYWLEKITILQRFARCTRLCSDPYGYGTDEYIEYFDWRNEDVIEDKSS